MLLSKRTTVLLSLLILLVSCSQVLVYGAAGDPVTQAPALAESPLVTIQGLLRQGPSGSAQAFIDTLPTSGAIPASLRAAALLETDRAAEAAALTPERTGTLFEKRLTEAIQRTELGAVTHLFDRFGEPVGYLDANSELHWLEGLEKLDLTVAELTPPQDSNGLRLTIDAELARRLGRTLEGVQGSIVVLDAHDGSVLYAGSDRRTHRRQDAASLYERLEPASIAKLMTTTAALRAGHDVDQEIREYRCSGMTVLAGSPLYCTAIGGRLTGGLSQALATSCNVAFADIGKRLGPQSIVDEYRRYGFTSQGAGPASSAGSVFSAEPSPRELGDLAIGLNQADMTPLHGAVMARSWIAGELDRPFLHLSADSPLGNSPRAAKLSDPTAADFNPSGNVLEPEWLPLIHSALESVTSNRGTASLISPRGFPVAMKTGTGQTEGLGFHTNYVGFAPVIEPTVAFAVRVRRGRTSRRTRRATKALTRQVLRVLRDFSDRYEADPVVLRTARDHGKSSRAVDPVRTSAM